MTTPNKAATSTVVASAPQRSTSHQQPLHHFTSSGMATTTESQREQMAGTISPVKQAEALLTSMDFKDLRYMREVMHQCLTKFCQFLDELPAEIRLRIYKLVLVEPDGPREHNVWDASHQITTSQDLVLFDPHWEEPALLRTCKRIRAEALPVYLEGNTFMVECYRYDPTALVRFYSKAKRATEKHRAIRVVLELDGDSLGDDSWQNIWRWLRTYYDGAVPCRPRHGFDLIDGISDELPSCYKVVSSFFDMLETLKQAFCQWQVVEKVLKDAFAGAEAVTDWVTDY